MTAALLTTSPWAWFVLAAAFAAIELALPGVAFIWLALAAAATGLLAAVLPLGWAAEFAIFAPLAIGSVWLGRRWVRRRMTASEEPQLNRRLERMVGATATVCEPIIGGRGKVLVGDSPWLATGPDLPAGARVVIRAVAGGTAAVEPA